MYLQSVIPVGPLLAGWCGSPGQSVWQPLVLSMSLVVMRLDVCLTGAMVEQLRCGLLGEGLIALHKSGSQGACV